MTRAICRLNPFYRETSFLGNDQYSSLVLLVRYSSRSAGLDHGHIDGSLNTEKGEGKGRFTDACSMIHKLSQIALVKH